MSEDWRAVPGWEGTYEVSSAGRVQSVTRTVMAGRPAGGVGPRTYQGRVLRAGLTARRRGAPVCEGVRGGWATEHGENEVDRTTARVLIRSHPPTTLTA